MGKDIFSQLSEITKLFPTNSRAVLGWNAANVCGCFPSGV